MLRGILFDFNGVLVDDEHLHYRLFRRVLREEGIQLSEQDYYRDYVGFDDQAGFSFALAADPAPADVIGGLCERKAVYYREAIGEHGFPFFPGAVDLVLEAASRGLFLGVVSGALRSEIEPALRQESLEGLFRVVVASDDVAASKPDPEGYLLGVQGLSRSEDPGAPAPAGREILAIEDTPAGLEAATGAGLSTLALAHTYAALDLDAADLCVGCISDVDLDRLEELVGDRAS